MSPRCRSSSNGLTDPGIRSRVLRYEARVACSLRHASCAADACGAVDAKRSTEKGCRNVRALVWFSPSVEPVAFPLLEILTEEILDAIALNLNAHALAAERREDTMKS